MTATTETVRDTSLTGGQLPKFTDVALSVISLAVWAAILGLIGHFSVIGTLVLGFLTFVIVMYVIALSVEGRRRAANRLARYIILCAFLIAVLPLVSLLGEVIMKGTNRFDGDFFSMSMRNVIGAGGGAIHAIWGTLIVTGLATLISVPIGLLTAVYLVEYGSGFLKNGITFLVDVMTGIPSIVAGLFAYALFAVVLGGPSRSALSGALALSVLMIPYVVRNTEEIIRLVPNSLREASFALGVTKWRTILKVVLPTSISGIVSGVIIAISRIIGETAPLLVAMGSTASLNMNPLPMPSALQNPMETLPVFVYYQYMQPGRPQEAFHDRAWAGALVLVLIVMVLNIVGRVVAKKFAPKINR